jgi:hypothetical protein
MLFFIRLVTCLFHYLPTTVCLIMLPVTFFLLFRYIESIIVFFQVIFSLLKILLVKMSPFLLNDKTNIQQN